MGEAMYEQVKNFHSSVGARDVYPSNCGYNDFNYIEGFKKYRVLDTPCIHWVAAGRGRLFIDGVRHDIHGGQMFVMLKGERVMYYPDDSDPWRYYWMNIRGAESGRYMSLMGFGGDVHIADIADPDALFARMNDILSPELPHGASYFKAMSLFFDTVSEYIGEGGGDFFIKDTGIVERAKDIIRLNYADSDFSVGMLGSVLHVSHSYICKLFKKKTGITAASYLLGYRLAKAAEMARAEVTSVGNVASACGFSDELYFMKKFKAKYGVTVKEYMRRGRDEG